jgi:hypothetical protein
VSEAESAIVDKIIEREKSHIVKKGKSALGKYKEKIPGILGSEILWTTPMQFSAF